MIRKASLLISTNQQTLYCANGWNGFYKSTNPGTSWTKLNLAAGYYADVLMMPSGTSLHRATRCCRSVEERHPL